MTTMLPQTAQARYRMTRAEQAAERYRSTRRARSVSRGRGPNPQPYPSGPVRSEQPSPRLVHEAAASSAFATGRG